MTGYYTDATGELEKAAQQYELWIHDYPHDPDAHNNLAAIYQRLGQYDKSAALEREELQISPDSGVAYANLAQVYIALSRLDEAKTTLDEAKARKLAVDDVPLVMYDPGIFAEQPNRNERAGRLGCG